MTSTNGQGHTKVALDCRIPWTARTPAEKARARRLVKSGHCRIAYRAHETYIGKRGLVNYEAWEVEPSAALSRVSAEGR